MSDDWDEDANPWIEKGVTRPFENDWFAVDRHAVIHPDGQEGFYTVVRPRKLASESFWSVCEASWKSGAAVPGCSSIDFSFRKAKKTVT